MTGDSIAIIDDYQAVATHFADWESLLPARVDIFSEPPASREDLVRRLEPYSVIVAMRERTRFDADLLSELPNLRLLVTTGSRNAAIDVRAARALGIVVSGTGGIASGAPELTWGLILALARHIPAEDAGMRAAYSHDRPSSSGAVTGWQTTVGRDLAGRTLGLLGLGMVGKRVARVGEAFDMRVVAWSENLSEATASASGAERVEREELFAISDVLSLHVRLSKRTRGLVGRTELSLMRPGSLLVNTARGPIVDEDALIEALQSGRLGGAALDVYAEEPLPVDHPLRTAPNTVLTPHVGYVTESTYSIFYRDALDCVAKFFAGTPTRVLSDDDGWNPEGD